MKFSIFQNSIQGPRLYNEDRLAYSYSKESLLMVVADGMGGHHHGEMAAELAVKMMTEAFQKSAAPTLKNPAEFLTQQIQQIHTAICALKESHKLSESPRTTIVVAIVQHHYLYVAHVGDSRLYHFRRKHQIYRTEDHSVVQALYRRGSLKITNIAHHPDRHKIYNCLGGNTPPKIDLGLKRELKNGDRILLCSDGLWSALSDDDLCKILHSAPVSSGVITLLNLAENVAGEMGDNISAIALELSHDASDPSWVSTGTMPLGETTTMIMPPTHQQNPEHGLSDAELNDDDIERRIAEIQLALNKTIN
jgi:PPM family protein phosphatase